MRPSAKWIWPGGAMYLQNCYAGFRHDFSLERLPSAAPLSLTADQSYRLYVNGRYVCRGPVRGYQESWHYDTVDILPFTGVTFPFLSNGGTSMIGAWGLLAFVKAADTRQNASFAIRLQKAERGSKV